MKSLTMICLYALTLFAGHVDTVHVFSKSMNKTVPCIVVLPASYQSEISQRFPVVYMLHAAGMSAYKMLDTGYCDIDSVIDKHRLIVVAPNDGSVQGDSLSWWLDSPLRSHLRYSTFVTTELKSRIDSLYRTKPDRANTGICGHSMGGFGALHNALQKPNQYVACCAIKAGLDIRLPFSSNWKGNTFGLRYILGSDLGDSANYNTVNMLRRVPQFKSSGLRFRFYNGLQDRWFAIENSELHQSLTQSSVEHSYFGLEENHPTLSPLLMDNTLAFFDSCFSNPSSIRKASSTQIPRGLQSRSVARSEVDFIGRVIEHGSIRRAKKWFHR